jgi:hypothetical protein
VAIPVFRCAFCLLRQPSFGSAFLSRHIPSCSANEYNRRDSFLENTLMYHYDAATALEELQEDALLPHPVKLRDMILRHQLGVEDAKSINSQFQDYLARFGESQKIARGILEKLTTSARKSG